MRQVQPICIGSDNSHDGSGLSNNSSEGEGEKLAHGDMEQKLIVGKQEQTGSDPAEAEASDAHGVSYLSLEAKLITNSRSAGKSIEAYGP